MWYMLFAKWCSFFPLKELKAFSCKRHKITKLPKPVHRPEFRTRTFLRKAFLKLPAVHYWERAFSRSYCSLQSLNHAPVPRCVLYLPSHNTPLQFYYYNCQRNEQPGTMRHVCDSFLCAVHQFSPPCIHQWLHHSPFLRHLHPSQANTFEYKTHLELNISYTLTRACFPTE